MAYRAGQAWVSILPSLRGFQREVAAQTRGMTATVQLGLDDRTLRNDLNKIGRQIADAGGNVRLGVSLDAGQAFAGLKAVDAEASKVDGRNAKLHVEADVAGAIRDTVALAVAVNQFANRQYTFRIDADTTAALRGVAMLSASVLGLGGGIGIVGGLAGALAGLAPVGAAAAGGIGAAVLAFGGVGDAVKALSAQQTSAATDAAAAAQQQTAAAERIRSAQTGLADAVRSADRAQVTGAQQVAAARQALVAAQEQGARSIEQANQRVSDSQRSLADAIRAADESAQQSARRVADARTALADAIEQAGQRVARAARDTADAQVAVDDARAQADRDAVQSARRVADTRASAAQTIIAASRRVQTAEETLQRAQQDSKDAQDALTRARKDAKEQLEDMRLSLAGAALDERAAVLSLARAQERLIEVESSGTASTLDLEEARLGVLQSAQALTEVRERYADLKDESSAAQKAGVDGADQVVAAQRKVGESTKAVADAQTALTQTRDQAAQDQMAASQTIADAIAAQGQQAEANARRVADAERTLADARASEAQTRTEQARRIADAERGLADAQAQAGRDAQSSARTVADAQRAVTASQAEARQAGIDAARDITAAQTRLAETQQSVAWAQQDATRQVAEAQHQLAQALAATGTAGKSAGDKVAQAFAELSPAAAAFATYLFSLKPILDGLQATAAAGLFPGLTAGIAAIVAQGPALNTMVAGFASGMGAALQYVLTELASPLWINFGLLLADLAGTWLPEFARVAMLLAGVVRDLLIAFIPLAPAGFALIEALAGLLSYGIPFLVQFLQPMIPAAMMFLDALRPLFPLLAALGPIFGILGQALATVLGALLTAITPVLIALTPLINQFAMSIATGLVQSLVAVTPLLVAVATWLGENPGLVLGAVAAISTFMGFLKPLAVVLGIVVSAFHAWLVMRLVTGALAALGLEGGIFAKILTTIISPMNLLRAVLPFLGQALAWIGRTILASLGPVGWLIIAFTTMYSSSEEFRGAINGLLGVLMGLVGTLIQAVMPIFTAISGVVSQVAGVFGELVTKIAVALVPVINVLAGVLTTLIGSLLPPLMSIITALVPVFGLVGDVIVALVDAIMPLVDVLLMLIQAVLPVIIWYLQNVLIPVITFVAKVIATVLVWVIENILIPILKLIIEEIKGVGATFSWLWENAIKPAAEAIGAAAVWLWQNMIKPAVDGIVTAWNAVATAVTWLWDTILQPIFSAIGTGVEFMGKLVAAIVVGLILFAWDAMVAGMKWAWENILKPTWDAISAGATWLWNNVLRPIWDLMVAGWDRMLRGFENIWNNVLHPMWVAIEVGAGWLWSNVLRPIWDAMAAGWDLLVRGFAWVWDNVLHPMWVRIEVAAGWLWNNILAPIWNAMQAGWKILGDGMRWVYDHIIDPIWQIFLGAIQWFSDRFDGIVQGIKSIWAGIQDAFKAPVRFVINTVWNDGIGGLWDKAKALLPLGDFPRITLPPGFAEGGIVPRYANGALLSGYSPGVDDRLIAVGGGEAIMRPEVGRGMGRRWVEQVNDVAKRGGPEAVQRFMMFGGESPQQFARGGVVEGQKWAKEQDGKPYLFGAVGPSAFDCSGIVSALQNVVLGDPAPYHRLFGTGMFGPNRGVAGWQPGLDSAFTIGVSPDTGGGIGHMAANLAGLAVESRGGDGAVIGDDARSVTDSLFPWHFFLPQIGGKFVDAGSGAGGGGSFWQSMVEPMFNAAADGLRGLVRGVFPGNGTMSGDLPKNATEWAITKVHDLLFSESAKIGVGGDGIPVGAVQGLDTEQLRNAGIIMGVGREKGFPAQGLVVALATALQESGLRNINFGDRDSVGLFQQRTSQGWGSIAQIMDPRYSSAKFFEALDNVAGWDHMPVTVAAQKVQRSAFPDAYAKWEPTARAAVQAAGFDQGGYLEPGVFNGTKVPEPVFTGAQWEDIHTLAARGATGSGGEFRGDLYLDSGEFMGVVHGVVQNDLAEVGTALTHGRRG